MGKLRCVLRVNDAHVRDPVAAPSRETGFEIFGVGFHDWGPRKAFDLYYDDIVLDSKRVGCLH